MLKELSVTDPDGVRQYLEKHAADMPRTAFRYATEKFDTKTRKALLKLK